MPKILTSAVALFATAVADFSGHGHVLEVVGFRPDESDLNLENFLESLGVSNLGKPPFIPCIRIPPASLSG